MIGSTGLADAPARSGMLRVSWPRAICTAVALCIAQAASAADAVVDPADPGIRDPAEFDPKRPPAAELTMEVADGFSIAAVGDLILSRPLSQHAQQLPRFGKAIELLRGSDVAFGNLETTIFDPRTFAGAPYSWGGDWTNSAVPAAAGDLRKMGFTLVGRANNHSLDWGLEGMRETGRWLDEAGIAWAGVGESHGLARAPAYVETPKGRIALVSLASTFRPTSESLPAAGAAPGRPGLSALRLDEQVGVPASVLALIEQARCALKPAPCETDEGKSRLSGTSYVQAERFAYQHAMDPVDLAEVLRAVRGAQQNADFVVVAIHSHECSEGCDAPGTPRGAADFLKQLARAAIDAGADMFVTTGIHNLGAIEIYDSPQRGKRPIFYGLGNFFWSDVQELLGADIVRGNRELLEKAWERPQRATEYDLSAPLNADSFANGFTFESVIARCRFANGELERIELHPVEEGYGRTLPTSGIPQVVTDEATARAIIEQVRARTAAFGLPELPLTMRGARAEIVP
jgi:poly-gamma-glutamate capsule biosynthesis protein CapA/YwtB (metallophosphatase superfamily)